MHDDSNASRAGCRQLIGENLGALDQLSGFVAGLTPEAFQRRFDAGGLQAVGKHVRHIIDHYEAFLRTARPVQENIRDSAHNNHLDYEQRQREARLEEDPAVARERLDALRAALSELIFRPGDEALTFRHDTGGEVVEVPTSLGRELIFLSSHTVHHMAIIALLAEGMGMRLPSDFGVHPSTLRYWQQRERQDADMARIS